MNNVSQHHQRKTEPWPQATCTKNLVKYSHAVFELCERTHTNRHINHTILRNLILGKEIITMTLHTTKFNDRIFPPKTQSQCIHYRPVLSGGQSQQEVMGLGERPLSDGYGVLSSFSFPIIVEYVMRDENVEYLLAIG